MFGGVKRAIKYLRSDVDDLRRHVNGIEGRLRGWIDLGQDPAGLRKEIKRLQDRLAASGDQCDSMRSYCEGLVERCRDLEHQAQMAKRAVTQYGKLESRIAGLEQKVEDRSNSRTLVLSLSEGREDGTYIAGRRYLFLTECGKAWVGTYRGRGSDGETRWENYHGGRIFPFAGFGAPVRVALLPVLGSLPI